MTVHLLPTNMTAAELDEWERKARAGLLFAQPMQVRIPRTPIPHGTTYGYTSHRCRCARCRQAMREYIYAWRHRQELSA